MIIFCLFALAVGSFLNVVIYRLPLMEQHKWGTTKSASRPINLALPRSFCPYCETQIPARYNIPLVSYLWLRGRCRHCSANISWYYPLVEALTLIISILLALNLGFNFTLCCALIFFYFLICICFIDLHHQQIPDVLSLTLLWLGLLVNTQSIFTTLANAIYGAVAGYIILWLFIKLYAICTGKIGMGHGDFKLTAALGAWLGWQALPMLLFIACLTGAVIGYLYLTITKQPTNTPIPFGPFLCIAGCFLWFYKLHFSYF